MQIRYWIRIIDKFYVYACMRVCVFVCLHNPRCVFMFFFYQQPTGDICVHEENEREREKKKKRIFLLFPFFSRDNEVSK